MFAEFLSVGDSIPNFPVYLLLGIVLWNYFLEVTSNSVSAIVAKGDLIRKINFPKYVIILSASFSALINLALNFIIITFFMVVTDVAPTPQIIFAPLLIFELFVLSLAVGFLLSTLYVRFRDISYIWEVILQAAFYATPILYPLNLVPEQFTKLLMLNPMAQIIQDFRYILVTPEAETIASIFGNDAIRAVPITIIVILAAISAAYFKKRSKYFAENV